MKIEDHFDKNFPPAVRKALLFAEDAHEGQMRKDKVTPYWMHPVRVVRILIEAPWHFTEKQLIAAACHDVIEDAWKDLKPTARFKRIAEAFGEDVAGMVFLLSKPEEEYMRSKVYFASMRWVAPVIIAIKLADYLDNLRDLPTEGKFRNHFQSKVREQALPLIDIIKMHGNCWHPYAAWIETMMKRELD